MAEARKKDPCRLTLKNVRLSYPNVFTPRAFGKGDGKPAYSAAALIPKDTKHGKALIEKIEDAIDAAKEKKWPGKQIKIKSANLAFADGDDLNDEADEAKPEQEGMMVVRARNYKRPMVLDENNDDVREQDNIIYGGCFVDMIVTFWGQDYEGTKRVNCSLEGVRYRDEGEAFGAGPINPDEFDEDDDDDRGSRRSSSRRGRDDDEDEKPSRSRRGRDDDEDERPSRSRRGRDEDDDEKPSRSRRGRDEDEDERPSRSRRNRDEDEDERPSRSRRNRDEDEDEKPSRSRRDRDEDDDEKPSRSRRNRDDDEDEKPSRSRRNRDEDEDERPSRRGRDEEDDDRGSRSRRRAEEDDEPRSRRRGREDLS